MCGNADGTSVMIALAITPRPTCARGHSRPLGPHHCPRISPIVHPPSSVYGVPRTASPDSSQCPARRPMHIVEHALLPARLTANNHGTRHPGACLSLRKSTVYLYSRLYCIFSLTNMVICGLIPLARAVLLRSRRSVHPPAEVLGMAHRIPRYPCLFLPCHPACIRRIPSHKPCRTWPRM